MAYRSRSSSKSRRSSSRSASPSSFSPQHSRSGASSARRAGAAERAGLSRGRAGARGHGRGGRRSRLSLGSDDAASVSSPEKKQLHQPAARRGGRKPLSSRLGVAKKKGYLLTMSD